eukprot:Rhum_TRINITY_DN14292_c17_g1::Rhum_TRINITY_DN14292_c17_g1_i1::g.78251::m.78251
MEEGKEKKGCGGVALRRRPQLDGTVLPPGRYTVSERMMSYANNGLFRQLEGMLKALALHAEAVEGAVLCHAVKQLSLRRHRARHKVRILRLPRRELLHNASVVQGHERHVRRARAHGKQRRPGHARGAVARGRVRHGGGRRRDGEQRLHAARVPDAHSAVGRRGDDLRACLRVRRAVDVRRVPAVLLDGDLPGADAVHACGRVEGPGEHLCVVGGEGDAGDAGGVRLVEATQALARRAPPHLHDGVLARRREQRPVLREGQGEHGRVVRHVVLLLLVRQILADLARHHVPHLHEPVDRPRHEERRVRRERRHLRRTLLPELDRRRERGREGLRLRLLTLRHAPEQVHPVAGRERSHVPLPLHRVAQQRQQPTAWHHRHLLRQRVRDVAPPALLRPPLREGLLRAPVRAAGQVLEACEAVGVDAGHELQRVRAAEEAPHQVHLLRLQHLQHNVLVQVEQRVPRQRHPVHRTQHLVPAPRPHVRRQRLLAGHGVQRHTRLLLQGLEGLRQPVLRRKLQHQTHHVGRRHLDLPGGILGGTGRHRGPR